jgi:REP element-mobilizing transposase RayT
MGQSLVNNFVHITFSTKNRVPLISEAIEDELYSYIGGICKNLECYPIKIGGFYDHIHILTLLSKKIALMVLLEKVKANSSKWIKTKGDTFSKLYWQNGYGAFSVNPYEIDKVISYIETQKEHHRKKTFQDEYRAFLKKYKVEYDEKYIWD